METKKCLVELDEVIKYLSKEDLERLPVDIRDSIKREKDKEYIWKYDETKKLSEQNLNRKTIIMLSYLNMTYLVNSQQKQLLKELHEYNERKNEEDKNKKYNYDNLFNRNDYNNSKNEIMLIEIKKDKWYKKVVCFFKKILKR